MGLQLAIGDTAQQQLVPQPGPEPQPEPAAPVTEVVPVPFSPFDWTNYCGPRLRAELLREIKYVRVCVGGYLKT